MWNLKKKQKKTKPHTENKLMVAGCEGMGENDEIIKGLRSTNFLKTVTGMSSTAYGLQPITMYRARWILDLTG